MEQTKQKEKSLEQNMRALEEISKTLEKPDISLDVAMKEFERAVKITKDCYEQVKKAEGKILELKKDVDIFVEVKAQEE